MSAIAARFEECKGSGQPMLVAYVTAGDPTLAESAEVLRSLDRAGADVIEVGVPFSDPVADGPAIQRAVERALAGGTTLARTLDLVAECRRDLRAPVVLFTYVNPVLRMGTDRFIDRAAEAGVNGVLLLDLPIEESAAMQTALDRRAIDQIFLVSPTTSDERLAEAGRLGRGFLYAISRLGVTGANATVAATAAPLVARIRRVASLPVALGFGISRPEHVVEVAAYADAAVVGSAIVQVIEEAAAERRSAARDVGRFVKWLKSGESAPGTA